MFTTFFISNLYISAKITIFIRFFLSLDEINHIVTYDIPY